MVKPEDPMNQFLLYSSNVALPNGAPALLLIGSMISPVDATVETLRTQLVCISIILVLFCALLAVLISRNISKPIVKINESAKELAHGNYQVCFEESGYRSPSVRQCRMVRLPFPSQIPGRALPKKNFPISGSAITK